MTDHIIENLSSKIDRKISSDLVTSFVDIVSRYRKGDTVGCLSASGKFVENALRAIEFIRTSNSLAEIKNATKTKTAIENDGTLPESLRILIPRIAMAMIYDMRSKRGAVHVKEIDPQHIDASLAVHSASWIMAEFLRLFHVADEKDVAAEMGALTRTYIPFVETFGEEEVVTRSVSCELEILLLLSNSKASGMSRRAIGTASKYQPPKVTKTLKKLVANREIHQTADGQYHITGPGERSVSAMVSEWDD